MMAPQEVSFLLNQIEILQGDALGGVSSQICADYGSNVISESDYEIILHALTERQQELRDLRNAGALTLAKVTKPSRYKTRHYRPLADRLAARDKRRMFGGSSGLPDDLRHFYSEGQRSVLFIIGGEITKKGECDLTNSEIGKRAGVGRTTVQNTLHQGRLVGHLRVTERKRTRNSNLPNCVTIVCPRLLRWIKRRERYLGRAQKSNFLSRTKNQESKKAVRGGAEWQNSINPMNPVTPASLRTVSQGCGERCAAALATVPVILARLPPSNRSNVAVFMAGTATVHLQEVEMATSETAFSLGKRRGKENGQGNS